MKAIGIDIGGTTIKYGLLDLEGNLLEKSEIETEASKGVENLYKKLFSIIESYKEKEKIVGIAISATGQIDGEKGKVIGGNDIIPGWIGSEVVKEIEKRYQLPTVLENDVNCAALGELWKGKGEKNFICLTIGTGIGGAIILNGELFRGKNGIAAEFGHIQIEKNGKRCLCGKKGCFERYASTTALIDMVKEETGELLDGKEIFLRALKNSKYQKIIDIWIDYLTDGLSSLVYIFDPNLVVIGGGVTKQGDKLLEKIRQSLEKKIGENHKKSLKIEFALLGNDAGIIGAEYLLKKRLKNN